MTWRTDSGEYYEDVEALYQAFLTESDKIGTFAHGYTYSGHPVCAAVALETLKIYDELDIGSHVRQVGPYMQDALQRRFADHELVGEVRGVGLVAAVELVADKATRQNFDPKQKIGARASKLMEAHGVIGRAMINESLGFCPPLVVTEREIDEIVDGTGRALDELAVQLRREKLTVVA